VDFLLLRARGLEEAADPSLALRLQAEEHGKQHSIPGWAEQVAELREGSGFAEIIRRLRSVRPNLVVHLDHANALQVGPEADGEGEPGNWKPGAEAIWTDLEELAADGILVVVSTRFASADLPVRSHLSVSPMTPADSLRMMSFFVELADLPPGDRKRLAEWADGHPRTIELLDRALTLRWNQMGLGYEVEDARKWSELVEPVLNEVASLVRTEVGLDGLWRGLPEEAREHARRIAARPQPLSLQEVDAMGEARDVLIRRGLLVRYREQVRTGEVFHWQERWGLPLRVREMVTKGLPND
jgi:hypothetical protein